MKIKNKDKGYSLIELMIAVTIFTIVIVGFGAAFGVSLRTARFQQGQALLNTDLQRASKLLDADVRQTGFLLAAGTNNTLPLFVRGGHPVAAVEVADDGKTLRCYRIGDESGGRAVEGITPAGAITSGTTEFTVAGNISTLTGRIGSSRAFLFVSEGLGRQGLLFITSSAPTVDSVNPNLVHLRGAFSSGPCLNVGDIGTAPVDYRGMLAIPVSSYLEYRVRDEGLVRSEYPGPLNPCGSTATSTDKLLIQATHFADLRFGYLRSNGDNAVTVADSDFPSIRGVMLVVKRRNTGTANNEFVSHYVPFIMNSEW